ncbi:nitroreductase [Ruegeria sp. 2012CJ41-6]|uniref:Nitroreductase n=1 Tax=Ruegeria spongiae TaxID=2942209 RepID=A0ABT0Q063_9RHOB|nr:nitroreductase [Ruegeria spongiae]MCL6283230.1 nitroreductase [Ruegeria spongiae]
MDLQALDALMAERHSCRAFAPTEIPKATIAQVLATARRAPSWCNAQPWRVDVTRGAATDRFRAALIEQAQSTAPKPDLPFPGSYSGVFQDRRRACGWALYEAVGVTKGDRAGSAREMMRNFALFDAPHCAVISSPAELGAYGAMDCGGFVTAFCLAAQALGIATIPQAAVASHGPFLHRYFDIPQDFLVLCAISFGYSDTAHPANGFRTDRAELDAFTQWHDG